MKISNNTNENMQAQNLGQGQDSPLPPLREDIIFSKGASDYSGAPSWLIYDPLRNSYFRISGDIFHLLSLWKNNTVAKLQVQAKEKLQRDISEDEISEVLKFLFANQLTACTAQDGYRSFIEQSKSAKKGLFHQLLHNYLFFRVPLVRPQKFLDFSWKFVAPLFTKTCLIIFAVLGIVSLYLVSRQWDIFVNQFIAFLSWQGIFYYGASLIFIKIIHELGHAFMAKKFGLQVPVIGVAFLVLFPVLYTDTSNAWSLKSRRQRLLVDGGGIFAELAVAILASILWVFCPDGAFRAVLFSTATLSWILSLAVNLNPFMRFDGYYLFCDLLGFENMQGRGFALGRWKLREVLFGVAAPRPEVLPRWLENYAIIYAWCTWVYRFFLFLGIAILVYAFFVKVVAIILFIAELLFFIFIPIFRELKEWWSMRIDILKSARGKITLAFCFLLLLVCFLPLNTKITVPAILHSSEAIEIYPPISGKLEKLNVKNGDVVNRGDIVAKFVSRKLQLEYESTAKRVALLELRVGRIGGDVVEKQNRRALLRELATERKTQEKQKLQLEKLNVVAPISGIVVDLFPEIHRGRYVSNSDVLFRVRKSGSLSASGLIGENSVSRVIAGASGIFYPDNLSLSPVVVSLQSVAITSSAILSYEEQAEIYGGRVAAKAGGGGVVPVGSYYRAIFTVGESFDLKQTQRGVILLNGESRSMAGALSARIFSVLIRESGF